jgi:hypothetical protein
MRGARMLLDWFSRKHIDEFADSIVAELLQRLPQSCVVCASGHTKIPYLHDLCFGRSPIGAFMRRGT